jgi:hypothetical protein
MPGDLTKPPPSAPKKRIPRPICSREGVVIVGVAQEKMRSFKAQKATYEDLRRVPKHLVAEILDGELFATPRSGLPYAHAASRLLTEPA